MPAFVEDTWLLGQATTSNVSELEDCAIAVDATYYLQLMLETPPSREPLVSAMGGLTGLETHISEDLDQWAAHKVVPLFIFDGQYLHGQTDVAIKRGQAAHRKADDAWALYDKGHAEDSVAAFGANNGALRVRDLYPLLQRVLQSRELHFLVAPYNAAAQIAHLDKTDSDQCAGIMGSQELLLYPIHDGVIRSIDWNSKTVTAIYKKSLLRTLNVSESTFIDALLMTGTSFLSPFPPLDEFQSGRRAPHNINDALNMLRTVDKSVAQSCSAFSDVLDKHDPNWLDRYRKARMAVAHYVYIAESGEVKVEGYDSLTRDNLQYLGLQLPLELYHYQNVGLVGGRLLSGITHLEITILPTLDGRPTEEYKELVSRRLTQVREQSLALVLTRLHRWIQRQDIMLKGWFDPNFSQKLNYAALQPSPLQCVSTWEVRAAELKKSHVKQLPGNIAFEILSLLFVEFSKNTFSHGARIKGINNTDEIVSLVLFRFLHLRGYVDDSHGLTSWGNAVAMSLLNLAEHLGEDLNSPNALELYEAVLMAFELIRFGVFDPAHDTRQANGVANGVDSSQAPQSLIARCATLLKLRHQANGYTGPLSRELLCFRSLSSTVREADRDLIEAVVVSLFLHAQTTRDRDDYLTISQKLPFKTTPDIAMGIAVLTFLNSVSAEDTLETRLSKLEEVPAEYVPNATHFKEDLTRSLAFFDAVFAGVATLPEQDLNSEARAMWQEAKNYREARSI